MSEKTSAPFNSTIETKLQDEITKTFQSKRKRVFMKLTAAALSSVPWVGSLLSAAVDFKSDEGQHKNNQLYEQWLKEHQHKLQDLTEMLVKVMQRLNEFPGEIDERLESDEYNQLVKKSFRSWDNAETIEKRELIRKLLTCAGTSKLVPDDLIRLFIDWIDTYHEAHFAIIKCIYQNPGITRLEIWEDLHGEQVRENSLEADLFKLLIRDLNLGEVIRQNRDTDGYGNYMKNKSRKRSTSTTLISAFDGNKPYVLTELGSKFVHYTMNEVVTRIDENN